MKLLTEKEIEKLGLQEKFLDETGESHQDFPYSFSIYCFKYAQKLLLESASEGFEEWWKNQDSISYPLSLERAWQTCSLSHAKNMQEKDAEIEELKKDLEWAIDELDGFIANSDCPYYLENIKIIKDKWFKREKK